MASRNLRKAQRILAAADVPPVAVASWDRYQAQIRNELEDLGIERDEQFAEQWIVAVRAGAHLLQEVGVPEQEVSVWTLAMLGVGVGVHQFETEPG